MNYLDSVEAAFDETKDTLLDPSAESVEHVATRVSGAEGVWFSLSAGSEPLPFDKALELLVADDFTHYYTRDVWYVSAEEDYRAPGLVGSCIVLGGWKGVASLTLIYALLLWGAWRLLDRSSLSVVLKAAVGNQILFATSENPFSSKQAVGIVVTCLVAIFVWRLLFVPLVERQLSGRVRSFDAAS